MSNAKRAGQTAVLVPAQQEVRLRYDGASLVLERCIEETELDSIQRTGFITVTVPRAYLAALIEQIRDF